MQSDLQRNMRTLWKKSRPTLNDETVDIYFSETYDPSMLSTTYGEGGEMTACTQMLMRRMNFMDKNISIGIVTALSYDTGLPETEQLQAIKESLRRQHRRMARQGALISLAFPGNEAERKMLADCGYAIASHCTEADPKAAGQATHADPAIDIAEETEWGRDLWLFYTRNGGGHDMEVKMTENDFYALIAQNDVEGGSLIVARRHGHIIGIALLRYEGKPLKSGKASSKTFRIRIPFILALQQDTFYQLLEYSKTLYPNAKQTLVTIACPPKGFEGSRPYAMVRIIRAEEFLMEVATAMPGLQLETGIRNDEDLPENNGGYRLRRGRCYTDTECPDSGTTPGGVPAIFMAARPALLPPAYVW